MHIDPSKCPQNHHCPAIKICPFDAIQQEGFSLPIINPAKCQKCYACVQFCPMGAITVQ